MKLKAKIKTQLYAVHEFFYPLSGSFLIVFFVVANIILSSFFSILSLTFTNKGMTEGLDQCDTKLQAVALTLILTPIVKAVVFQYGIIEVLKKKHFSTIAACLCAALLYALFHLYNVYYFLFAFCSGCLMGYLYSIKGLALTGLILAWLAHVLFNLFIVVMNHQST